MDDTYTAMKSLLSTFSSLPLVPVEPSDIHAVHSGDVVHGVLEVWVAAPSAPEAADLDFKVKTFAIPNRHFHVDVVPRASYLCSSAVAKGVFARCVASHLRVAVNPNSTAAVGGVVTTMYAHPSDARVHIIIPSTLFSRAPSFNIEMTYSGVPVSASAHVIVGANHAPAIAGRLFSAVVANNVSLVAAALCDGCSTEEADKVSARQFCIFSSGIPCLTLSHTRSVARRLWLWRPKTATLTSLTSCLMPRLSSMRLSGDTMR